MRKPISGQPNAWHYSLSPSETLIVQNRLQEIPGVGPAIAQVIIKLYETGTYPSLEKMRAEFPETLLEMLTIPGLRPDKILKLHSELGVSTLDELVAACLQDKLKGVRGLGPALQRKILAGVEARKNWQSARHMHQAADLLQSTKTSLERSHLRAAEPSTLLAISAAVVSLLLTSALSRKK